MITISNKYEQREKVAIARALFLIKTMPDTRPAVEWLKDELARLDAANRTEENNVTWRQRQGAQQILDTLNDLIYNSGDLADELQSFHHTT